MKKFILMFAATTLAGVSLPTLAVTVNFGCITNTNDTNCADGASQLTVDITDLGSNQINFSFINASDGVPSSITEVYFDDGTLLGLSTVTHSAGDAWTGGSASPPSLPGGNNITPVFTTTTGFLAESNPPPNKKGVQPGEYLDVVFSLLPGVSFIDTVNALGDGSLRIGVHVTSFTNTNNLSESFVNTEALPPAVVVPVPAAVWLFGSGLLGLAGIVRCRKV